MPILCAACTAPWQRTSPKYCSHHPDPGPPNPLSPSWATYSLHRSPYCFSLEVTATYFAETLKDTALFLVRTPRLLNWLWYLLAV